MIVQQATWSGYVYRNRDFRCEWTNTSCKSPSLWCCGRETMWMLPSIFARIQNRA